MIGDSGTVFVLGAGFTKAFLPQAPLLIDDYGGEELKGRFADYPEALSLLEMELLHPDHAAGRINLERLMTRLSGGMPYDFRSGAAGSLALLLAELKKTFVRRLAEAQRAGPANQGELRLFAGHCVRNKISCITFNYDDLLDEALWNFHPVYDPPTAWSPDWGYGFPCPMSEGCVREVASGSGEPGPMLLLKLHGSVNWRIPLGHSKPFAAEAIRHHELWFTHFNDRKVDLERIEPFLETEPLLVPPVLTKTELVEQPILRLTWSLAIGVLRRARRVVFLGYSLPPTDIAAGFLFREGLRHLDAGKGLTVVNYARDDRERTEKLPGLLAAYRNVLPGITAEQFDFSGAAQWVGNHLTEWLYDSSGSPVAFNALGHIVSRDGRFIGTIRGYEPTRRDIWHGIYKGEIVQRNRLLSVDHPPMDDRGGSRPPPLPQLPVVPESIDALELPRGYRDIDWADEGRLYAKPVGLHDDPES